MSSVTALDQVENTTYFGVSILVHLLCRRKVFLPLLLSAWESAECRQLPKLGSTLELREQSTYYEYERSYRRCLQRVRQLRNSL